MEVIVRPAFDRDLDLVREKELKSALEKKIAQIQKLFKFLCLNFLKRSFPPHPQPLSC